ncbi:metallophosphoesterase [Winogradskyella helgolandensis]|uniref:metallophosphoesterase n=1 Tax=Winogradskyella helgolandensis TaxID=2697010 RepID=UPI0015BC1270|nr:metallophosphoesterase [Winogradskyella helgolandensis]
MKNKKRRFFKIIKWIVICICGYWFLSTLVLGHTDLDSKTGIQSFGWSGLDALFSNQEFGFFKNEPYKTNLKGADGPYVFSDTKFWVNNDNIMLKENFKRSDPIDVSVNNDDKDKFEITLKNINHQEPEFYDSPTKLIAISDIEGNYNALYSFLVNNKVIDKDYNWIFGNGHLVLNGDFFDRGTNVTQVLWLIYSLEEKAEDQDGKVHFINGNHEIMNLYGDISYADFKYVEAAKQISNTTHWEASAQFLYSEKSELGKWLRTKNVVEKIGDYIFVHGGLNKSLVDANFDIPEINAIAKAYYGRKFQEHSDNSREKLIVKSQSGPYWDRSLAMNLMYKTVFFLNGASAKKTSESELDEVLEYYNAKKIVIGHSVVDDVTSDYNGKVIKIDVKHGTEKNSKNTQGLLIERGVEYKIDALGTREKL